MTMIDPLVAMIILGVLVVLPIVLASFVTIIAMKQGDKEVDLEAIRTLKQVTHRDHKQKIDLASILKWLERITKWKPPRP